MADILTQLQTCLDQLATQFYATLCYLSTYHDHSAATPPPNIPDAMPQLAKIPKNQPAAVPMPAGALQSQAQTQTQNSPTANAAPQQVEVPGGGGGGGPGPLAVASSSSSDPNVPPAPDSPRTFGNRQRELARDLIIKEQQIEFLISRLPGIGSSEAEQESRIRELEAELRAVKNERERKARELKRLGRRLEKVLGTVERGIYGERDDLG